MALPIDLNPHWLASAAAGYQIERSLRFNSADSSYLSRTPGSAGNRRTFSLSFWIKSGSLATGTTGQIMGTTVGTYDRINFGESSTAQLSFTVDGAGTYKQCFTPGVHRDPSSFYHCVIGVDTTQATPANRVKIYINGIQQTLTGTFPDQNYQSSINNNVAQYLGSDRGSTYLFSGYLTEIHFIDGQQLSASSFGETDATTGVWKPKAYTGTYGTNGFYLNFSDNSGTTSTTLGKDYSGNGNNWTPNGFSIGTIASKTLEITDATKSGNVTLSATIIGSGTVDLTGFGGAGNLAGPTFTGLSSITGYLSDWGTHTVYKNGSSLFTVQGGKVYNDGGSQTATQTRTAQTVTQTGISVSNGDVISIAFGVNSSVTSYYGYPGGAPSLSITAAGGAGIAYGPANDSLVDTPTPYGEDTGLGGEVRGNYCTLNTLDNAQGATISDGNLKAVNASATDKFYRGTFGMSSGKWYWEVTLSTVGNRNGLGVTDTGLVYDATTLAGNYSIVQVGNQTNSTTGSLSGSIPTFADGDIIAFAFDVDSGILYFEKNAAPNTSTSPKFTGLATNTIYFVTNREAGGTPGTNIFNFGQRAFQYTATSNYKALCTTNLPTPTIKQGDDYFNIVLYTGNGTTISNNTVGFQPDFVWIKGRSGATNHQLFDSVRGTTKVLVTNSTEAETTSANTLTSFDSSGFTVGSNTALNTSTATYVAWNWKASGSNVTNNDGTITSTVRASTTSGFSIATFTQLSGSPYVGTVGHGLGVAPSMVIIKDRSIANGWLVYHAALGATQYLVLSSTAAAATGSNAFNNTAPTSTVFTTAAGSTYWGNAGATAVAYCFAEVAGYSRISSYVGNGSTDGPFVYCGFRPKYILGADVTDAGPGWFIRDTARDPYNQGSNQIVPQTYSADDPSYPFDILSNGFKPRSGGPGYRMYNASGSTHIFIAFAENPFKYALAR